MWLNTFLATTDDKKIILWLTADKIFLYSLSFLHKYILIFFNLLYSFYAVILNCTPFKSWIAE